MGPPLRRTALLAASATAAAALGADLLLLSKDPTRTPPAELQTIDVLGTWLDGQPVDSRRITWTNVSLAAQVLADVLF